MANLSNINGKFVVEQTTGYVGIGITDPSQLLHLQSTADTILKIDNITSGTGKSYLLQSTTAGSFVIRDEDASSNRLLIDTSGNATFVGNVDLGDSSNITMAVGAPGQLRIKGSGYTGAIALDATAMYIYHDSSIRDLVLGTNETARLTINGSNGNATFAGDVTVNGGDIVLGGTGRIQGVDTVSAGTDAANKAYVDSQVGANNELSEVLANGNTTGGTNISVSAGDDIDFTDTSEARFGSGQDLIIKHTGTTGSVTNFVGNLNIVNNANDSDIRFFTDDGSGGVTTYFQLDGSHTQSIAWKDIHFVDGIKAKFGDYASPDLEIYHDGTQSYIYESGTGRLNVRTNQFRVVNAANSEIIIDATENGAVELYYDAAKKFETTSTGVSVTGEVEATSLDINGNADISGTLSGNFVVRSTNNANIDGANFAVDTTNKSASEYAYEVLRSGTTVAGITMVGKITGTELEGTSLDINGNADISGNLTGVDTLTATTFSGDLNGTINTVTTATTKGNSTNDTTVATTAFVQNVIGTIPAGLVFQGTWNASTNSPTLTSGSGTTGNFYIVSVAGSTNLDGITDWQVGDWAVFIEQGASDQWEKIDNSSVLSGSGTGGSIAGWSGSGTSVTLGNSPVTFSGNNISIPGTVIINNTLYVAEYIQHLGNTSNNIRFTTDAIAISANATFAGGITTTSATGIKIDTTGNAILELDGASGSTEAIIFRHSGTEVSRISHSNSTSLVFSTGSSVTTALTINTSQNATFAGDVQAPGIYVGATNTSFDFYNNGTSYLNGAVTVDAAFTQSGGAASSFSGLVSGITPTASANFTTKNYVDTTTAGYRNLTFVDGTEKTDRSNGVPAPSRTSNPDPQDYDRVFSTEFKNSASIGSPVGNAWAGLISMAPYNVGSSGFKTTQLAFAASGSNTDLYIRQGAATTWGNWSKILTETNSGTGPFLPLSAGSSYPLTGPLYITSDGGAANGAEIYLKHANNNTTDTIGTLFFGNNADATLSSIVVETNGANNTSNLKLNTSNAGTMSTALTLQGDNDAIFTGNVGIGTTNIGTQSNLYLGAINSSEGGQLTLQKATGGTLAAHIDAYTTGGNDYMRILSGGDTSTTAAPFVFDLTNVRVGIGTTNPGSKLEINENSTGTVYSKVFNQNAGVSATARMAVVAQSAQLDIIATSAGYTGVSGWADSGVISTDSGASGGLILNAQTGGLKLQTGLSTKMVVLADGNVGIGTTLPSSKLHVTGAPANGVYLSYLYNSATHNSANGLNIQTSSNNILTYGLRVNTAGDSNALAVMGNGSIGIGTASPATKLNIANAGEVIVRSSMTAADGFRGGFEADNQHTGGTIWSMFSTNNSDGYFGGGKYVIANESMGGVDANTTAQFVIDGSGNVGIGTTSPASPLTIKSNSTSSGSSGLTIQANANTNTIVQLGEKGGDGGRFEMLDAGVAKIALYTDGTNNYINAGNVGIGTTSPTAPLMIAGSGADGTAMLRLEGTAGTQTFNWISSVVYPNMAADKTIIKLFGRGQATNNQAWIGFKYAGDGSTSNQLSFGFYANNFLLNIKANGNVGIGTESPRVQTEIQGLAQATANINDTGNSKGTLQVSDTANALNAGGTILFAAQNDGGTYTPQAAIKSLLQNGGLQGIGDLAFSTRNATSDTVLTERMRIKSDGNILVAGTRKIEFYNTSQYIYANSTNDLTLASGDDINFQTNYARFFNAGVESARISATTNSWIANGSNSKLGVNRTDPSYNLDVSGTIRATGDIIAYSDVRVKENIKTIDNSLEKVSKLRGVEFNKIGDNKKSIGVIAQEIEKVIPEVVKEDDKGMKSVAYGNISGLLIEAIKELKAEIEELKKYKCDCKR